MSSESAAKTKPKFTVITALYIAIALILYACYSSGAYPQGDDVNQLLSRSGNPLPNPGGWIANRVVDSFFSPYLFLLFHPLNVAINGDSFFQSYSKYAGLLNAGIACLIIAKTSNQISRGIRTSKLLNACIIAACLSLTLFIVYGDTTHTIAYNLTWLVTFAFITSLVPISWITNEGIRQQISETDSISPFLLLVLAYFTAFGHELYMVFAWIYLITYASLATLRDLRISVVKLCIRRWCSAIISKLLAGFTSTKALLAYLLFSTITIPLLLSSGRSNISSTVTADRNIQDLTSFAKQFATAFISNKSTPVLALLLSITFISCALAFRAKLKQTQGLSITTKPWKKALLGSFFPFSFSLLVSIFYLIILLIAGYKDSTIFVSNGLNDNITPGRSLLFLAPILFLNLSVALRSGLCLINDNQTITIVIAFIILIIFLSSTFRFLYMIREDMTMRKKVSMAFESAAVSSIDAIEINFCLPRVEGNDGYPILPGPNAAEWYRQAYRIIYAKYYGRYFTQQGPVFKATKTAQNLCSN